MAQVRHLFHQHGLRGAGAEIWGTASFRGDLTPYWEDGAGSFALETALSRNAADRITQAEALASTISPAQFDAPTYHAAWRDVLMYSEHTWGAWCSVSDSEIPFTKEQWAYKRNFAVRAAKRSEELISGLLDPGKSSGHDATVVVYNATSWDRTEIVLLSRELSSAGDHVADLDGRAVPSQRLSSGELAVLVTEAPAFGGARFFLSAGEAYHAGDAVVIQNGTLQNGLLKARLDDQTGDIAELTLHGISANFVDREKGAQPVYLH